MLVKGRKSVTKAMALSSIVLLSRRARKGMSRTKDENGLTRALMKCKLIYLFHYNLHGFPPEVELLLGGVTSCAYSQ